MKQWQLKAPDGTPPGAFLGEGPSPKELRLAEVEEPSPGPGQVLVRMRAASLNYRDLLMWGGQSPVDEGRVPLSDGAGEVVALGPGASAWQVGDRVAGTFFRGWLAGRFEMKFHQAALGGSVDGVLSELVAFDEHDLVRLPESYSFEEGACLPCAGVTAWAALQRGGFRAGDTVLLLGTGGVSVWGLQIVAASGGRAIVTSSSDAKLERARELGAWASVNYRTHPEWQEVVWEATAKVGADHVLEVGGSGTLGRSLASLAPGGHLALIGVLTGAGPADASVFPLATKNARASGIYVGSRQDFEELVRFLNVSEIHPIIDRAFDFEEAPEAYKYLQSASHIGKVVVSIREC
jgi:NADPH:quinone reductase-like Zn-dependent oxidoreductase